jgi:hypothetical protein
VGREFAKTLHAYVGDEITLAQRLATSVDGIPLEVVAFRIAPSF